MILSTRIVHFFDAAATLFTNPSAFVRFHRMQSMRLGAGTYFHVNLNPPLVYLAIPKVGSSTLNRILSRLNRGTESPELTQEELHDRRLSKVPGIMQVGLRRFFALADRPSTLRFALVRNPYDRLVSCYSDKFARKPLVPGDFYINQVLEWRARAGLPASGSEETLTFPAFVDFALATLGRGCDPHYQRQSAFIDMALFPLDLIGRIEESAAFMPRIEKHLGLSPGAFNERRTNISSRNDSYSDYYDAALAARVHAAYRDDFERFGYSATLG